MLVVVQLSTCALKFFPAPILLTVPIELGGPKRAKERAPRFFTKSPLYLHFLVVPGAKASCHIAEAVQSLSVSAKLLPLFSGTA